METNQSQLQGSNGWSCVCSLICDAKFYGVVVILSDNQLCSPRRSFLERKKKQEVIKPAINNVSE